MSERDSSCQRKSSFVSTNIYLDERNSTNSIRGSPSEDGGPSYFDLLEENRRLRAVLDKSSPIPSDKDEMFCPYVEVPTVTEAFENAIHPTTLNGERPSSVRSISDIYMPSATCSQYLLEHGVVWTSWIHFAVHVPTFRAEHCEYWAQSQITPILYRDPSWLAIYFGFLSVRFVLDFPAMTAANVCVGHFDFP